MGESLSASPASVGLWARSFWTLTKGIIASSSQGRGPIWKVREQVTKCCLPSPRWKGKLLGEVTLLCDSRDVGMRWTIDLQKEIQGLPSGQALQMFASFSFQILNI